MTYVDALQTTLAAEHAAVFVYAALGGQTSQSSTPALYDDVLGAYDAHRARRDQLTARLVDQGVEPVASQATYVLPADLGSEDLVTRRARQLERACAATYAYLVASSPTADRRLAITALNETAVRELVFRGAPEMLPGSSEYADR